MNREKDYTKAFKEKIESRGWIFKKASREEDMYDHVDCHVLVRDMGRIVRTWKIDLKGRKYNCRANEGNPQHLCQYVEFLNVRGDKGWLFGEADYIVVEGEGKFHFIEREVLIAYCESIFHVSLNQSLVDIEKDLSKHSWTNRPELHKLYRRLDRKDLVTLISMENIQSLTKFTI